MKTIYLKILGSALLLIIPFLLKGTDTSNNTLLLSNEIQGMVTKGTLIRMANDSDQVTVKFLINAQNELVILEATGENELIAERVKEILNYRQVKYKGARQLVPYTINIRFHPAQE